MTDCRLIHDDCLIALPRLLDEGVRVDAVCTDPPYHLASIVSRLGNPDAAPIQSGVTGVYARSSAGFMGQQWDGGDVAFQSKTWRLVSDLMRPGAHLVAFGGTRTYHRLVCAIEDAGFEIRDQIGWLYGTGFPKSHNLTDAWAGWGTALKPAWEPIVLARKPLVGSMRDNVGLFGTGALNIDACRVASDEINPSIARRQGAVNHLTDRPARVTEAEGRMASRQSETTYRQPRDGEALGRWPANIIHDGSDEVSAAFSGSQTKDRVEPRSAARFFYAAKANAADRAGSHHPTVKPVALMRWLVRLITPPAGLVLDPFAGTGTTGAAARAEGMAALLIEQSEQYVADIRHRLDLTGDDGGSDTIGRRDLPRNAGPLFGGS